MCATVTRTHGGVKRVGLTLMAVIVLGCRAEPEELVPVVHAPPPTAPERQPVSAPPDAPGVAMTTNATGELRELLHVSAPPEDACRDAGGPRSIIECREERCFASLPSGVYSWDSAAPPTSDAVLSASLEAPAGVSYTPYRDSICTARDGRLSCNEGGGDCAATPHLVSCLPSGECCVVCGRAVSCFGFTHDIADFCVEFIPVTREVRVDLPFQPTRFRMDPQGFCAESVAGMLCFDTNFNRSDSTSPRSIRARRLDHIVGSDGDRCEVNAQRQLRCIRAGVARNLRGWTRIARVDRRGDQLLAVHEDCSLSLGALGSSTSEHTLRRGALIGGESRAVLDAQLTRSGLCVVDTELRLWCGPGIWGLRPISMPQPT